MVRPAWFTRPSQESEDEEAEVDQVAESVPINEGETDDDNEVIQVSPDDSPTPAPSRSIDRRRTTRGVQILNEEKSDSEPLFIPPPTHSRPTKDTLASHVSSDPLAMGSSPEIDELEAGSVSGSEFTEQEVGSRRDAKGKGKARDSSVISFNSDTPTPPTGSGRADRGVLMIEIPFMPLSQIATYHHPYPLKPPHYLSRLQTIDRQRGIRTRTRTGHDMSRSPFSLAVDRPVRAAVRKVPDWRVAFLLPSEQDMLECDQSESYGTTEEEADEETDGNTSDELAMSDDDIGPRRSKRVLAQSSESSTRPSRNVSVSLLSLILSNLSQSIRSLFPSMSVVGSYFHGW